MARFESQRNERRVCEDQFLLFEGRYDCQRTLAIRIAAITLANDSAITIARFRPSKLRAPNPSKPLFYWVVASNCSEKSLVLFVRFCGFGVLFWPLFVHVLSNLRARTAKTLICTKSGVSQPLILGHPAPGPPESLEKVPKNSRESGKSLTQGPQKTASTIHFEIITF